MRINDQMKVLVLDTEPTWAEAYCRWMGSPLPERKKWKLVNISPKSSW